MRIKIAELIGTRCMVPEDGQKIYDLLMPRLSSGEEVYLDFESVRLFASPFFNFAIGQLLNTLPLSEFRRLLHLENINDTGRMIIERVVSNASIYHGDKDYKRIVDQILEKQAGGVD